nr:uncharacterized protein LOC111419049 isoform X2 [Onthophagus taurus]
MHFRYVQKLTAAHNGVVTSGAIPNTLKPCPSLRVLNTQTSNYQIIMNNNPLMLKNLETTHSFNCHQESTSSSSYVRSKSVPPNVKLHQLIHDLNSNVKKSCVLKLSEKKRKSTSLFSYPQQKRGYSTFLEKIKNFFTFRNVKNLVNTEGNQSEVDGFYFKIKQDFFSPDRICKDMPEMRILKLQKDYYRKHGKAFFDRRKENLEIEDFIERQIENEIQENLKLQEINLEEEQIEIEEKHLKQIIPLKEPNNKLQGFECKKNNALSPNDIVLVTDKERRLIGCKYSSQMMDVNDEDNKSITINLKPPQRNYQKSLNFGGFDQDKEHTMYSTEQITSIRKKTTLARSIKIFVSDRNQQRLSKNVDIQRNRFNVFEMATKSCDEKCLKIEEDSQQEQQGQQRELQRELQQEIQQELQQELQQEEEKVMSFKENVVKHIEMNRSQMMKNLKKFAKNKEDIEKNIKNEKVKMKFNFKNNHIVYKSWNNYTKLNKPCLSTTTETLSTNKSRENKFKNVKKDNNEKFLSKLNVNELKKIEVAVDALEEHVSKIPQMFEKVHFIPADVLEELGNVEDEIKKEKEEKFNLVRLKRSQEAERVVTPIKFYEERKVKPIQLIEEERRKVKPITFDELSKIVTTKEVKTKIGDVQLKAEENNAIKPFLQLKFKEAESEGYKPKVIKIEIDDEKLTVSKSLGNNNNVIKSNLEEKDKKINYINNYEKKLDNPINTKKLDDSADKKEIFINVIQNELKNNDLKANEITKKSVNLIKKIDEVSNEKETKSFNVLSFDYKGEDKKLGVKFFDPEIKLKEKSKTAPKEIKPTKIVAAEPIAYQIGGGHSLLCQIKNLQDAKMKNTMRDSIRFMDQVKETLRWDFGDSYTKEVIHVNPDLKTSTTRILPHDPKTPYSQIWIKLNDFRIISVQADVRKKEGQMIRGLLKDQGKKLLCPFQNLGGLQKRDYPPQLDRVKIEKNLTFFENKIEDKETYLMNQFRNLNDKKITFQLRKYALKKNPHSLFILTNIKRIEVLIKYFDSSSSGTSGSSRSPGSNGSSGSKSSGSTGSKNTSNVKKAAEESTNEEKYKVRRRRAHRCAKKEISTHPVGKKRSKTCKDEAFGDTYSKHRARMCKPKMKNAAESGVKESVVFEKKKMEKTAEDEIAKKAVEEKAKAYKELVHTVWKPRKVNRATTLAPSPPKRTDFFDTVGDARIEVAPYGLTIQRQTQDASSGSYFCEFLAVLLSIILFCATFPFSVFFCVKTIKEYQRAVILRMGRLNKTELRGPGLIFFLFCIDEVNVIDIRTITLNIPPQSVLTKDSVTTNVEAVIYYSVSDPINSCVRVKNCSNSTKILATTILKNILGTKNLSEILSDKEAISSNVKSQMENDTDNWGIRIERVEIYQITRRFTKSDGS